MSSGFVHQTLEEMTHVFQQTLQLLMLVAFDEDVLIVDVLDDEVVMVLCIDFDYYGFD